MRVLAVVAAVLLLGRAVVWEMSSIRSSSGLERERNRSGV